MRKAAFIALSAVLAFSLCGCKPTDFFTEVVIAPWATEVDEDNPDKTYVNSPDAEEETDSFSALDWTDDSALSKEVQNLVVYGSEPNTTLSTHHSVFDLLPRFAGIEASDGVRLLYDEESDLDHEAEADETDEQPQEEEQPQAMSEGGTQDSPDAAESPSDAAASDADQTASPDGTQSDGGEGASSDDAQSDETGGNGDSIENQNLGGTGSESGPSESGGSESGGDLSNPDNSGAGNGSAGDGSDEEPSGGLGGDVEVYDPDNRRQQINHADSIAVIGRDAAVLAQAIGGTGAVCAVTQAAWDGLEEDGTQAACASTFGSVFGADGNGEAADTLVLWENDGSSPSDVSDIDALVEACGTDGVIIYDQTLGNKDTLFSEEQRAKLASAGIQLAPVDMSTAQGLIDAATVIGDALQESSCANDAQVMASTYQQALQSVVSGASATATGSTQPMTTIATEAESGAVFDNDYGIDTSGVLLWGAFRGDYGSAVDTWYSSAGVSLTETSSDVLDRQGTMDITLLWPLDLTPTGSNLHTSHASSRWYGSWTDNYGHTETYTSTNDMAYSYYEYGWGYTIGLGTYGHPYLVVCADDIDGNGEASTKEVKDAVVDSMESYREGRGLSLYSYLPFVHGAAVGGTPMIGFDDGTYLQSSVGSKNDVSVADDPYTENPFYTGLSAASVVRESPVGLLGAWDDASMEGVLTCAWVADLFSHTTGDMDYTPANDMSEFSCVIDGVTCTTLEQAVEQFYVTFYRLDDASAQAAYEAAVPDRFDGLQ